MTEIGAVETPADGNQVASRLKKLKRVINMNYTMGCTDCAVPGVPCCMIVALRWQVSGSDGELPCCDCHCRIFTFTLLISITAIVGFWVFLLVSFACNFQKRLPASHISPASESLMERVTVLLGLGADYNGQRIEQRPLLLGEARVSTDEGRPGSPGPPSRGGGTRYSPVPWQTQGLPSGRSRRHGIPDASVLYWQRQLGAPPPVLPNVFSSAHTGRDTSIDADVAIDVTLPAELMQASVPAADTMLAAFLALVGRYSLRDDFVAWIQLPPSSTPPVAGCSTRIWLPFRASFSLDSTLLDAAAKISADLDEARSHAAPPDAIFSAIGSSRPLWQVQDTSLGSLCPVTMPSPKDSDTAHPVRRAAAVATLALIARLGFVREWSEAHR